MSHLNEIMRSVTCFLDCTDFCMKEVMGTLTKDKWFEKM